MRVLSVAVLAFAISAAVAQTQDADEEKMIASVVPLAAFHEKMLELDAAIAAEDIGEERKQMLAERLQELSDYRTPENEREVDDIVDINANSRLSQDFYEGDILLTKEQIAEINVRQNFSSRARRQAWKPRQFPKNIWGANTPIPYTVDSRYPKESIPTLLAGMKYWEDNTCLRFKPSTGEKDGIKFFFGQGCYSWIGKIGGEQIVSIGPGCEHVGTVTHELGHTIGLYHTQSRTDRDQYVIINKDNIQANQGHNFDAAPVGETDNFGVPYEYGSNMHYHPFGFTKNRDIPTLVAVDKAYQFSMDGALPTFYDILLVNKYYGCFDANCKGVSVTCQNGGVQDVKNCRKCRCPTGYAGDTCATLDPKFKRVSSPPGNRVQMNIGIGNNKWELAPKNAEEFIVLEAPAGKHLEVIFNTIDVRYKTSNCLFGGVMVWTQKDTRMSGFKSCDKQQFAPYYLSQGERIFIHAWNRFEMMNATFTHRSY